MTILHVRRIRPTYWAVQLTCVVGLLVGGAHFSDIKFELGGRGVGPLRAQLSAKLRKLVSC